MQVSCGLESSVKSVPRQASRRELLAEELGAGWIKPEGLMTEDPHSPKLLVKGYGL